MPIINRVADLSPEIATWRRDFHENPELLSTCTAPPESWQRS
jgi:metal-dependent amidase/aminoacylase/carboxypeptidase family protein